MLELDTGRSTIADRESRGRIHIVGWGELFVRTDNVGARFILPVHGVESQSELFANVRLRGEYQVLESEHRARPKFGQSRRTAHTRIELRSVGYEIRKLRRRCHAADMGLGQPSRGTSIGGARVGCQMRPVAPPVVGDM